MIKIILRELFVKKKPLTSFLLVFTFLAFPVTLLASATVMLNNPSGFTNPVLVNKTNRSEQCGCQPGENSPQSGAKIALTCNFSECKSSNPNLNMLWYFNGKTDTYCILSSAPTKSAIQSADAANPISITISKPDDGKVTCTGS